jgi:hypothetical protein
MRHAIGVVLLAAVLSGCADQEQREWGTAEDAHASADDIIDHGNAGDIAQSGGQLLITWVVDPEDDEGPAQGAWRLYGKDGSRVADGSFGQVREASARMDVWAVDDGFVLQDYVKSRFHHVSRTGKLAGISIDDKTPRSLVGAQFVPGHEGEGLGQLGFAILPNGRMAPLPKSPTDQPQDTVITADGELWVGLPWSGNGENRRFVHAKDGRGPWVSTTMALPTGTESSAYSMSTAGRRVFVPVARGDAATAVILTTSTDGTKPWRKVSAKGLARNLTVTPSIQVLPDGRLFASTSGEGAWIQQKSGSWKAIHGVKTAKYSDADVSFAAGRLWSSEWSFGHSLKYSTDYGKTWTDFKR